MVGEADASGAIVWGQGAVAWGRDTVGRVAVCDVFPTQSGGDAAEQG